VLAAHIGWWNLYQTRTCRFFKKAGPPIGISLNRLADGEAVGGLFGGMAADTASPLLTRRDAMVAVTEKLSASKICDEVPGIKNRPARSQSREAIGLTGGRTRWHSTITMVTASIVVTHSPISVGAASVLVARPSLAERAEAAR
jgi:hypothetical protein